MTLLNAQSSDALPLPWLIGTGIVALLLIAGIKWIAAKYQDNASIKARTYLNHLQPEYLRYYFAAKLGSGVNDIDLSLEDFQQRVNSDVVGKLVNIASRCAGFIVKKFDATLTAQFVSEGEALFLSASEQNVEIKSLYEQRKYS